MSAPSKSAVLLTIALAAVCGSVAGGLAFLVARPGASSLPAPEPASAGAEPESDVPASHDSTSGPSKAEPADAGRFFAEARKGGRQERAEFARLLDSTDPDVAYAAALEAMLRGPEVIGFLRGLDPPTDRGRELVAKMIPALELLDRQQRHKVYDTLWDDKRLELRQEALDKVIPETYLDAQAEEYYAVKVARDRERFEAGNIEQGELFVSEVFLAGARARQGKIPYGDVARMIASREDVIAEWLEKAKESNRFAGRRFLRLKERYEALKSL